LLLLLTLTGFHFQYMWVQRQYKWALFAGSIAFGVNLLTRLTTGLDILAGALFVIVCLWHRRETGKDFLRRIAVYASACLVSYGVCALIDRLYHFYRFGTFSGTYIHLFGEKWRYLHPELPQTFPFNTPFKIGFLGPLITPEKSIFLFDPLLIATTVLFIRFRKSLSRPVNALLLALIFLLFSYITFYARYFDWSGDSAWGDRFVTTPVQLLAMLSVPLLLQFRLRIAFKLEKSLYLCLLGSSLLVQVSSVIFSYNLEIMQKAVRPDGPTFIIGLRLTNILAKACGKFEQWGLSEGIPERISMINLTPFGPVQGLPTSVRGFLVAAWIGLLVLFLGALVTLVNRSRRLHPP
jgi:hypothetical protein